jgi:rod shape-determining protein MreD
MITAYLKNILIFIAAVMLQVFVLDNINLGGYLNPYFYVIFLLLLPFETPKWAVLILAFFLGFTIDIFNHTYGMHAAASVFMGFLRPFALKAFSPREGYDTGTFPRIAYYGFYWFVKYAVLLIVAHHFLLFTIEVFRFDEFFHTFIRIISSSILTALFVVASQFFVFRS